MRKRTALWNTVFLIGLSASCDNDKKFGATAPVAAPTVQDEPQTAIEPQEPVTSTKTEPVCQEGKVDVGVSAESEFYAGYNKCRADGNFWYYKGDASRCIEITQTEKKYMESKNFAPCDYSTIKSHLAKLNGLDKKATAFLKAEKSGANLVACALRDEGKTVIVQWLDISKNETKNDCNITIENSSEAPTTACYRLVPPGKYKSVEDGNATTEEMDLFVDECLFSIK